MKKHTKKENAWKQETGLVIGIDLGDKMSAVCVRGADGKIRHEDRVRTGTVALQQWFGSVAASRVVIEVGTHSPWVGRQLEQMGHEVIVANPRRLKLISESDRKSDGIDARLLSELGQAMPRLLNAVKHRSAELQADLMVIRARARMVEARTKLWVALRGLAKSAGRRLPRQVKEEDVRGHDVALLPLWEGVVSLSEKVREYDRQIERLAAEKYPQVARLRQVTGVGSIIALTFILTLGDAQRFRRSRHVASYLGLRPRQRDSGERQPQLSITKTGDCYLRSLLVQGAQYILGRLSPDTDLKRWGLRLAERGGKNAKKRAVVAVARKLSILLHRLWVSGAEYQPLRQSAA